MKQIMLAMLTVVLVACGGGNSSPSKDEPAPIVQEAPGIYRGLTDTGRKLVALVLDNGNLYFLYGAEGASEFTLSGAIVGIAGTAAGDFTSVSATDIDLESPGSESAKITANYVVGQYLTGTVDSASEGAIGFTTAYDSDYDKAPDLSAAAGEYLGHYKGYGESASDSGLVVVTINEDGSFTGTSEITTVCRLDGKLSPRTSGNIFDVTVSFPDPDCVLSGKTFSGAAYHDSGHFSLYMAAPTIDLEGGVFFYGLDTKHLP